MRAFLAAVTLLVVSNGAVPAADLRNFDDAALHAVQFVDEDEGWTVGDDGVIWHTIDGGQNWERQPTGLRASLRSLHFLNPYVGWVVGREELPHAQGSVGVLLYTRDGGLHWRQLGVNAFPGLNHVRFADENNGFLVGDGNDQYPTGIFRTVDGGRSWKPVGGPRHPSWLAADFQDGKTGALAGGWGTLGVLREGKLDRADMEDIPGARAIRGVQVAGSWAIAVGQGGLVLVSRDTAGARWSYATTGLAPDIRAAWDFHAVHGTAGQIWIAGRPGSAILHSPDRGQTWDIQVTGQPLPLHGVFFASAKKGWAVGELGSILHTSDGGKSWRVQQRGGQRTAALFVHARPTGLPLDTVAQLGGEDGYLIAGLRALGPDPLSADPARVSDEDRLTAALRRAGGAAGEMLWQFPLPAHQARATESELVGAWNPLYAGRAREELLRQLVLALRIWRPEVTVTDPPAQGVEGSLAWPSEGLVAEALLRAVRLAADPQAFPEQLRQLGLQTWEVKKVYARWEKGSDVQVSYDLTRISSRLENTLGDFTLPCLDILVDSPLTLPARRSYHVLDSRLEGAGQHRSLFQGLDLAPGGVARRRLPLAADLSPELEKSLRQQKNLESMLETPAAPLADPNRLVSHVEPVLKALPEDPAAQAAYSTASRLAQLGRWELARELFLLMVNRYPNHPLSVDAYRWLIRYSTSGEARRRHERQQFWVQTRSTVRPADGLTLSATMDVKELPEEVRSGQVMTPSSLEETRRWYTEALELGNRLAELGPLYANDPSIQFCLQAAHRALGDFDQARAWYAQFHSEHADGPWRDAAGAEIWLANRLGSCPKPVAYCRQTASPPVLDGQFSEACWQGGQALAFHNATGDTLKDYPTEAGLAFDHNFLYVALRCRHPADRYVTPVKVRPTDADLRAYDRVSLLIDTDRDYSTYYRLEVDERGCVCDDCWGDRSWNPRWFVALHSDRDGWQAEIAIPTSELTGENVIPGKAWAFNLVRTLPGRGVQAWSLPADVQPRPEGMGLLLFIEDRGSQAAARTGAHLSPSPMH
jgi:photosystem II stability/assembly factor-like uncharacterized protein/tetratricopeptide (TPR) repeat protein